ncbi:winged helix-turn-helix domain-containing protein [Hyphomicrobiales bacterium]|nr:winged helix-turn-helix domain-containing protein [Hyphomicrobiales bacterium]
MIHQIFLFSKNMTFNMLLADLFIGSEIFQLNVIDKFALEKKINFSDNDVLIFFCSEENSFEDFKIFLKNNSFKKTALFFNATKEDEAEDKSKALFFNLPVSLNELLHELQSIVTQNEHIEYHSIKFKKLSLDMVGKHIKDSEVSVKLTDKEAKILWHLVKEKGSKVSQNFLLDKVWGYKEDIETKTLTTHIYTIRKKINYFNDTFFIESFDNGYRVKLR